ncbi:MAG: helix-turn-helix domain-containing protein [Bacteroidales bacterium]|nr:helix-turn-helix domain-containing protein [Bacteroidales bacterium]
MNTQIRKYSGYSLLDESENVHSIDRDFMLLDKAFIFPEFLHPFRMDLLTAVISIKGFAQGKINLKLCRSEAPGLTVIMADQILQHDSMSDDYEAVYIVMSRRFLESLNVDQNLSAFRTIRENPYIPLSEKALHAMLGYYNMMLGTIAADDNPYRLEIAKNLTRAFFYGIGYYIHKMPEDKKNKNEQLAGKFLKLLEIHFKEYRDLSFYAEKLCLTPKYMSTIIKEGSGKSAGEWIDSRVMLEAKVLLKSASMTAQQIADLLNFPTQSSFSKYFKRLAGMSPKEYRNS